MLRAKLEAFHNRCVRAMCGVTRTHVRSLSARRTRGVAPAPWHPQHAAAHLYPQAALGRPRGEDGRGEVAPHQVLLLLDQRLDQASCPGLVVAACHTGTTWRGNSGLWASTSTRQFRPLVSPVTGSQSRRIWTSGAESWQRARAAVWTMRAGLSSGVAPPCMSVNVSSCHKLSPVTEVSTADVNPSSSQSSLTGC